MTTTLALLMVWIAAESDDGSSPSSQVWDTFAGYGVLGVAALLLGWLVFRILNQLLTRSSEELAREVARGDRLEAENRTLNAAMQDKAIPALLAAANALTEVTEMLRDQQRDRWRRDGEGR